MKLATESDVIIVGGGLAGLTAGEELAKRKVKFILLEARGRLGGRTYSQDYGNGEAFDLGAQWVGPTQKHILDLIKRFNLKTIKQDSNGKKIVDFSDTVTSYVGDIPKLGYASLVELHLVIRKLNRLMKEVSLASPQYSFAAKRLDAMTVSSWFDRNVHLANTRKMLSIAVNAIFAADPAEISFLHFLFYLHSGDGLEHLIATKKGAQDARIVGGAQQLSNRIAEPFMESIRLNSSVHIVQQNEQGLCIHAGSEVFQSRYVIMALPPILCTRIRFLPGLSSLRQQMLQHFPMGSVIKCVVVYPHAFWKESGYCGEAICDEGPLQFTFDDTPGDGNHGAIVGFITGNQSRKWSTVEKPIRKRAVLRQLSKYFGTKATEPLDYLEVNWSVEEFSAGCYAGYFPPNAVTEFATLLRKPEGRIHWAGTETASKWNGYMDGAVESGCRVAEEVSSALLQKNIGT